MTLIGRRRDDMRRSNTRWRPADSGSTWPTASRGASVVALGTVTWQRRAWGR